MTPDEAIRLAEARARALGFPWDSRTAVASRRRLWPFPATWRVVSQVASPRARTTMSVSERLRTAFPETVIYRAAVRALTRPLPGRLWLGALVPAVLAGGAAFVAGWFVLPWLHWPRWIAILLAVFWAMIAPVLAASIRIERSVDLREK